MKVTVIGVAGGTGSGKSTLVKRLQEAFVGDDVVTLCHDYYYKAHPELTYEERTKLNYDHPQAFDTQMLVDHIKALKDNGINVVEVTSEQKDAFIESAASVYDLFIEKYGGTQELIDLAMKYNDDF